jgi:hypothetical protein
VKGTTRIAAACVVLAGALVIGGALVASGPARATPSPQVPATNTATVERGKLEDVVSAHGTLTFAGRPDGAPYTAINWARGIYTDLPTQGDKVACGDVLYRVDERPVLLLCGAVPAYRALRRGEVGPDVRELNANLHALGDDTGFETSPDTTAFTANTETALRVLQKRMGQEVTGALGIGDAIFLPGSLRIGKVSGALGGPAQPGTEVFDATSDAPVVRVDLDPSQQGAVRIGDTAQIVLPDNGVISGKVARLGNLATVAAGQGANAQVAIIPVDISLDNASAASGFDGAPVQVDIATAGVENALSVPVVALVGKPGGGFAVEVVRANGQRELVAVKLGLFDTAGGRVQVEGHLHVGDRVVVPSS